jgi:hypothetical protein
MLRALGIGLVVVLSGCNTPSVPIPPPVVDLAVIQMHSSQAGEIEAAGAPTTNHAKARFYLFNVSRSDGVIADAKADGSFATSPFPGASGDTLQIYFDAADGRRSAAVCTGVVLDGPLIGSTCP